MLNSFLLHDISSLLIYKNNDDRILYSRLNTKYTTDKIFMYVECIEGHYILVICNYIYSNSTVNIHVFDSVYKEHFLAALNDHNTLIYKNYYKHIKKILDEGFKLNIYKINNERQRDGYTCGYRCLYIIYKALTDKNFSLSNISRLDFFGESFTKFLSIVEPYNKTYTKQNTIFRDNETDIVDTIIKELIK